MEDTLLGETEGMTPGRSLSAERGPAQEGAGQEGPRRGFAPRQRQTGLGSRRPGWEAALTAAPLGPGLEVAASPFLRGNVLFPSHAPSAPQVSGNPSHPEPEPWGSEGSH